VSIAVAILGLAFLIFVHELGHFVVARAVGMRPRKFYVGFPPAAVKWRRNGIEYGIGTIPLGGFVKIPGMHRPAAGDLDMWFGRAVEERPALRATVERLRARLEEGDHVGARPIVEELRAEVGDGVGPDAYWRASTWRRVAAILAGPAANVVLAVGLFAALFATGSGRATSTVDAVVAASPAARAGLQPGDRILAIDGRPVEADEISDRINASRGRPIDIRVERGGEELVLEDVRARLQEGRYRVGLALRGEGLGVAESVWEALRVTGLVTKEIGAALARLATGEGREDIASPVGIVQGSSAAADEGAQTYLWVLGLISLSLALMNLLPLLPLDGGHIAFSIAEGLRGRAVRREIYERVSAVGLVLVLLLFFVGLSNDINRLGGG
jgi:regulator of sigma E protease